MKRADEILKPWPKAWMGMKADEVFGEKRIAELRPTLRFAGALPSKKSWVLPTLLGFVV